MARSDKAERRRESKGSLLPSARPHTSYVPHTQQTTMAFKGLLPPHTDNETVRLDEWMMLFAVRRLLNLNFCPLFQVAPS